MTFTEDEVIRSINVFVLVASVSVDHRTNIYINCLVIHHSNNTRNATIVISIHNKIHQQRVGTNYWFDASIVVIMVEQVVDLQEVTFIKINLKVGTMANHYIMVANEVDLDHIVAYESDSIMVTFIDSFYCMVEIIVNSVIVKQLR